MMKETHNIYIVFDHMDGYSLFGDFFLKSFRIVVEQRQVNFVLKRTINSTFLAKCGCKLIHEGKYLTKYACSSDVIDIFVERSKRIEDWGEYY